MTMSITLLDAFNIYLLCHFTLFVNQANLETKGGREKLFLYTISIKAVRTTK
ncbi:hypothetical protein GLYMA_04G123232v4 [Glycine max]|nr:hypothetical protein GLYMA_04G123232v4 [Glycine max]KAH1111053.1 hypothetical protein GYH30_009717 [Glycine max]